MSESVSELSLYGVGISTIKTLVYLFIKRQCTLSVLGRKGQIYI